MARMIPPRGAEEFTSGAEQVLYREMERQLSDDYAVLHSVSWLSRQGGRNQDGEADFVIAHPRYGVLVVEVKGGQIFRNPLTGDWVSRDSGGIDHPIKDPFAQATKNLYSLRDRLAVASETRAFHYHLARAVAFPDVLVDSANLGPDAPREIVIDSGDLATLVRGLQRAWASPPPGTTGEPAVAALIKTLRPPVALSRPGLVGAMRNEEAALLRLTNEQMTVLDFVRGHRQVAVSGCAGSGKTLLAIEATKRLAREGYRVLFTCYTRALANEVQRTLESELGPAMARVEVDNYHDLATRFATEAGIALPDPATLNAETTRRYYDEALPDHFLEAMARLPRRFDAIVVDEGQDFAEIWWATLDELFAAPEDGILYVFYDEAQRLFDQRGDCPIPRPHFTLSANCRTTRAIDRAAAVYRAGGAVASCRGPEGREPVQIALPAGGELAALRAAVHELVSVEGVPVEEIVVLTPRSLKTSLLPEGAKLGNLALTWGEGGANALRCRSIAAYKGLESPVVILAEPERAHAGKTNVLLHVALTRAKHHVVVLGPLPPPETGS